MIFYVKQGPVLNFTIVNLLNCHDESNILFIMLIVKFFYDRVRARGKKRQEKLKTHFSMI